MRFLGEKNLLPPEETKIMGSIQHSTIPIQKKFNIKHSFRGKTLASFQNYLYLCIRLIKIEV